LRKHAGQQDYRKSRIFPAQVPSLEDYFPTYCQLIIHLRTPSSFREVARSAESDVSLALIQLCAVVLGALAEERSASQTIAEWTLGDGLSSPNRYVPSGSLHLGSADDTYCLRPHPISSGATTPVTSSTSNFRHKYSLKEN